MSNFDNVLSAIETISKENIVHVYIPSLRKDVDFKGLTTGQQKSILKAAVDNPVFQTRFTIALYNILRDNCIDKQVFNSLTWTDAIVALIQLRINVYGVEATVTHNNAEYRVDLSDVIENSKNTTSYKASETTTGPFTVNIGAPTLTEQYQLEAQLREKTLSNEQNTSINDTIGDAFVGEISKYIKEVSVKVGDVVHVANYSKLDFSKKHSLLEKLPTDIVQPLMKDIESITAQHKNILTVTGINTIDSRSERVVVDVNASLFAVV